MASANRLVGKALYVGFADGAGTAALGADFTSFSYEWEQETADVSAGADAMRVFAGTIKNFSATLEALYLGAAGTATYARVEPGDAGTLIWGPEGSAAGKPKFSIPAIVSKVSHEQPFDEAVKYTIEFLPQGDLVSGHSTSF